MRVAAVLLGVALFAGLIVLAVAGVSAATAVLVTAGAVVAMIGLGNAVGGRQTPNRAPYGYEPDEARDRVTADPESEIADAEPDGADEAQGPER
jgi:hypothetical protein